MKKLNYSYVFVISFIFLLCFSHLSQAKDIIWNPSDDSVNGYRIYYSKTGTDFELLSELGPEKNSFSLESVLLEPMTIYYFAVTAFNSMGESTKSNFVTYEVDDNTPPLPPTGLIEE